MKFLPFLLFAAIGAFAQSGSEPVVRTPFDEQNPRLSPDGQTLYVTIAGNPENRLGKKDPGDIWAMTRTADGWSEPMPQTQWNNSAWNSVIGFSSDGARIYLAGHYRNDGEAAPFQGMAVCRRTESGWSAPENIRIPFFTNRSVGTGMWYQPDSDVLLYSASTPLSGGAEDLYISLNSETGWSEPMPLSGTLNSAAQEWAPALDPSGRFLYFSSNRPGGKGSFDLYRSERQDSTWLSWSTPIALTAFNTSGRELFAAPLQQGLWFASTTDSDGYGDVRFAPSSEPQTIPPMGINPGPPQREVKEEYIKPATGRRRVVVSVTAQGSGRPVEAQVTIRATGEKFRADNQGKTSLELSADETLVEISGAGYITQIRSIAKGLGMVDVALQAVEVGAVVKLPSVLFEQGTPDLVSTSYDELDMVVRFMQENPKVRILLAGHTDGRGDRKLNQILSEKRVKKVKNYLVSKGIKSTRIEGKGYGGSKPIADGRTESGRKLNRRVEFSILSK